MIANRQYKLAKYLLCVTTCVCALDVSHSDSADKLRLLIVDGQNNHDWKSTTPLLSAIYEKSGRFQVEIATSPPARHDMSQFNPCFSQYDVVVSNYNGERWSREVERSFEIFLACGGGFVVIHAANNAFPGWPEYNAMTGLGGWGGRTQSAGPYVYYRDNLRVRDSSAGRAGHHGHQHEFEISTRNSTHPIMSGIPAVWRDTKDELYDHLRGTAFNLDVLATAYSDPKYGGTGRHEPILMTVRFGEGRVFHNTLGHADYSINCVGFATLLLRGTEWAATGKVTCELPKHFPTAKQSRALD